MAFFASMLPSLIRKSTACEARLTSRTGPARPRACAIRCQAVRSPLSLDHRPGGGVGHRWTVASSLSRVAPGRDGSIYAIGTDAGAAESTARYGTQEGIGGYSVVKLKPGGAEIAYQIGRAHV